MPKKKIITPIFIIKKFLIEEKPSLFINKTFLSTIEKDLIEQILILFRVQYENNEIATIGTLQKLYFSDISIYKYINYIINTILFKDDHYKSQSIKNIIFSYAIREIKIEDIKSNKSNKSNIDIINIENKNDFLSYYQYKLPIAFNPKYYENVLKVTNYDYICPLTDNYLIQIKYINKKTTKCKLFKKNELVLEYRDSKINENKFIRKIENNKFTFEFGELILKECIKKTRNIQPLKKSDKNDFNFLTLDIETYLDDNNYQIPYCICIYDGVEDKNFKFFLNDFETPLRRRYVNSSY